MRYAFCRLTWLRWFLIGLIALSAWMLSGCSTVPVVECPKAPDILLVPPPPLPPLPDTRPLDMRQLVEIMIRDAAQYREVAGQLEPLQVWIRK